MHKAVIYTLCLLALLTPPAFSQSCEEPLQGRIDTIEKYTLSIPAELNKTELPQLGFGSGLHFLRKDGSGNLYFYCITDRGPNLELPNMSTGESAYLFTDPDFSPLIGVFKISPDKTAEIVSMLPIQATGKPWPPEMATGELQVPFDEKLNRLPYDPHGVDSESIDVDQDGYIWVGDEYGPSLMKVDPHTGTIIERYLPGKGLPEILSRYQHNRGFEAIAITPNGLIYAFLEGTFANDPATGASAKFIRFVEFNPTSKATRMFMYPLDRNKYKSIAQTKLGDAAALNNTQFYIIEQGPDQDGKMHNTIQLIDISNAQDITGLTLPDGLPIEYGTDQDLAKVSPIKKEQLVDMRDHGWPHKKMEGLAVIDAHTLAISNDNDFGVSLAIEGAEDQNADHYSIESSKTLLYKGQPTQAKFVPKQLDKSTVIWLINLKKEQEAKC